MQHTLSALPLLTVSGMIAQNTDVQIDIVEGH